MLRSKKNKSVVSMLHDRELNNRGAPYFLSVSVISQLLRSDTNNSLYANYWGKSCSRPITYDSGYLYFSDYIQYCSIYGKNYEPSPLYKMQKSNAKKKISDVISYSIPVYKTVDNICKCGSQVCTCLSQYLLSISEDNWLCQHLMANGKLIRQIYANRVGQRFHFKYCDWDVYGERFVLTSTLNPELPKPSCKKSGIVVNLAIFNAFPFEFLALLEIKRSVFGETCSAANISDQHLIVGLGHSQVHIYSFEDFLSEGNLTPYKLGESYGHDGTIGSYPTGLPLNFKYDEAPPLLFNVQCCGQIVRFGGYPYHYITQTPRRCNDFTVTNIETNSRVLGGTLESCAFNDDVDAVLFHPDHSNRLIFKSDSAVDCYKLTNTNGVSKISKMFSMGFFEQKSDRSETSSFGRKIKSRDYSIFFRQCSIFCTDYASDLDLFAILGVFPNNPTVGFVKLYDSVTGEEVRTVELRGRFCDSSFYELYVDMGSIIILERKLPLGYNVHVYYL